MIEVLTERPEGYTPSMTLAFVRSKESASLLGLCQLFYIEGSQVTKECPEYYWVRVPTLEQ